MFGACTKIAEENMLQERQPIGNGGGLSITLHKGGGKTPRRFPGKKKRRVDLADPKKGNSWKKDSDKKGAGGRRTSISSGEKGEAKDYQDLQESALPHSKKKRIENRTRREYKNFDSPPQEVGRGA